LYIVAFYESIKYFFDFLYGKIKLYMLYNGLLIKVLHVKIFDFFARS
jgi:hypothetical protein